MVRDLLYSLRVLRKSPRFTSTAVLVLALGIGANSAIFSLVYSVLLRPLPYQDPGRLAVILGSSEKRGGAFSVPPADYLDFRERNHSFSSMAAAEVWGPSLTDSGEAEELHGLRASASLFEVLGVRAAAGRVFLPEDGRTDAAPVVVLGDGLFKRRFGGDVSVIGRTVTLNQASYTVVGVLPESFYFPPFWALDAEIYTPLVFPPQKTKDREMSTLRVFARLKPGTTWAQASGDMRFIARDLAREYPRSNAEKSAVVTPLHEMAVGNVRASLTILLGAVGCTLLIACANLANLFLVRATARHKEVAIRQALGAARGALVRQLMTESLLVCFAGGVLGLLAARWAVGAFVAGLPGAGNFRMPRHQEIALGAPVIAFNFAICLLTGLLFGLMPALRASRTDLNSSLKESARGSTTDRSGLRIRGALVVSEIALALMLLSGAGLLVRSFQNLRDLDPGFDPHHVVAISLPVSGSEHAPADRRAAFYREVVAQLRAMPGVQAASAVNHVPIAGDLFRLGVAIEGRPAPRPGDAPSAAYRVALPGYFQTIGMRLVRGRDFEERDNEAALPVAVINQTMAQRFWPGEDALGKRFRLDSSNNAKPWMTVVGIIHDARQWSWAARADEEMYIPFLQDADYLHNKASFLSMTVVARTRGPVSALAPVVRERIRAIDRNIPVAAMTSMEQVVADAVWQPRMATSVLSGFAVLALVLATTGIFAVMSYIVAGRTQEIGIRMALGARQADVLHMVLLQSLRPVALGVALGLCGALALTRLMTTLLYQVSPTDPFVLTGVTLLLAAVAAFAGLLPARRAARIDPLIALRHE
jgi:putative ABC transport system permease protein